MKRLPDGAQPIRPDMQTADLVTLQAKAALLDEMAEELRLYRGFCMQFDDRYANSKLFRSLSIYDALFGDGSKDCDETWP